MLRGPSKSCLQIYKALMPRKSLSGKAVESSQPDVIITNETWLKPDMLNGEMMPPGYNPPIRKDRPDGYGGVLLAPKSDIIDAEIQLDCGL